MSIVTGVILTKVRIHCALRQIGSAEWIPDQVRDDGYAKVSFWEKPWSKWRVLLLGASHQGFMAGGLWASRCKRPEAGPGDHEGQADRHALADRCWMRLGMVPVLAGRRIVRAKKKGLRGGSPSMIPIGPVLSGSASPATGACRDNCRPTSSAGPAHARRSGWPP